MDFQQLGNYINTGTNQEYVTQVGKRKYLNKLKIQNQIPSSIGGQQAKI